MSLEALICLADQLAVELPFADVRFVPCNQEDRLALPVEGEGYSPFAIRRTESQFLHVRVAGAVQRIDAGPPQLRPELLEKAGRGQNLSLHVFRQREELRFELVADLDDSAHLHNMAYNTYGVKYMYKSLPALALAA